PNNNSEIAASYMLSGPTPDAGWIPVTASTAVPAGTALWVYARQETTVILTGAAPSDSLPALTGQRQFIGNALSEPIALATLAPVGVWLGRYDSAAQAWSYRFPDSQSAGLLTPGPFFVPPGRVFWANGAASGSLSQSLSALQVRYYHQDHLGSTAVVTDRNG